MKLFNQKHLDVYVQLKNGAGYTFEKGTWSGGDPSSMIFEARFEGRLMAIPWTSILFVSEMP